MLVLILFVAAFVLFCIATFNVPARFNLVAASLACGTLALLLGHLPLR